MNQKTAVRHVGLQYNSKESARVFFNEILELDLKKSFTLSRELSKALFGISEDVTIDVYENDESYFEVFITKHKSQSQYQHICIEIEDKENLIKKCKKYGLEPILVKKNGKDLLFIRDFSNNLTLNEGSD